MRQIREFLFLVILPVRNFYIFVLFSLKSTLAIDQTYKIEVYVEMSSASVEIMLLQVRLKIILANEVLGHFRTCLRTQYVGAREI